jgi:hypothetical protein
MAHRRGHGTNVGASHVPQPQSGAYGVPGQGPLFVHNYRISEPVLLGLAYINQAGPHDVEGQVTYSTGLWRRVKLFGVKLQSGLFRSLSAKASYGDGDVEDCYDGINECHSCVF